MENIYILYTYMHKIERWDDFNEYEITRNASSNDKQWMNADKIITS